MTTDNAGTPTGQRGDEPTLEQIIRAKQPNPYTLEDLAALNPGFESDEEIDEFIASYRADRGHGPQESAMHWTPPRTIRLTAAVMRDGDGYTARALEVELASQGRSIEQALENLREAVELYFETEPISDFTAPIIAPLDIRVQHA